MGDFFCAAVSGSEVHHRQYSSFKSLKIIILVASVKPSAIKLMWICLRQQRYPIKI
jgi:hypothetical protein